jgi:enoyl-CoA hydratase
VWPSAEFEDRVWDFCRKVAGKPVDALGVAKLAIDLCKDLDRSSGRTVERIANTPLVLRDNQQRIDTRLANKTKDEK